MAASLNHRNHRLLDLDGQPVPTETIDIRSLMEIDRSLLHGLPERMECRLFNAPGREPAIVLFHPTAELYEFISLGHDFSAGPLDVMQYVEQLDVAVLKQAMGEGPEQDGYRIDGGPRPDRQGDAEGRR